VLAEILGAQGGMGRIIQAMGTLSATDDLMACLIWLAVVAVAVDGLLMLVGSYFTNWREK
jgi:ABC-type nitrate/sulfonate/bicarbonate transport system permease component